MNSKMMEVSNDVGIVVGNQLGELGKAVQKRYSESSLERPQPMSRMMQTWYSQLSTALKVTSSPPKVYKSTFRDARQMFGTKFDIKVPLRNAESLGAHENITLTQFDPNFMTTDVQCRHPSCGIRNPEAVKNRKRDLYLCPHHRQVLKNSIRDTLAKMKINIPTTSEVPEEGQFTGYTSLIGLLEKAYYDAKKFGTFKEKSKKVEEAILNARNFLIITSTVLNPDLNNLEVVLPPVFAILRLIVENPNSVVALGVGLVYLLREVMEMILFAFGVVYTWVSLALYSPGGQIGAGLGGTVGVIAGSFFGPWGAAGGLAAGGGLGGLIGNGIYNLIASDPRQQAINRFRETWVGAGGVPNGQPNNQYPVYYFDGDAFGGLYLHPFPLGE